VNTGGAWEAGVDGALPGIAMLADPRVGDAYYQEYYEGEAEDYGEVVEVDVAADVPAGSFTGCVKTRDTTKLEPDVEEFKTYCEGIGVVLEEEEDTRVELQEVTGTPPPLMAGYGACIHCAPGICCSSARLMANQSMRPHALQMSTRVFIRGMLESRADIPITLVSTISLRATSGIIRNCF
jgi:hypothetical protein